MAKEQKKKNKKILGIPVMLFVIGALVIGGASAALVTYLSNMATAEVTVDSPMEIAFAKIGTVDSEGAFAVTEPWTTSLTLDGTTGLSTSELGVRVINNADIAIEDKWLQLTVRNDINNVSCGDISNLMFWDTATPTQIAKGYQELSSFCDEIGSYVVYDIDINSLGAGQTFRYPVKLTFGVVEPADYSFSAEMLDTV